MNCTHCGKPLPDESDICPACGEPVAAPDPNAETAGHAPAQQTPAEGAPSTDGAAPETPAPIRQTLPVTGALQKELLHKNYIAAIIFVVFAPIILAAGVLLLALGPASDDLINILLIVCGAILLACGVSLLFVMKKTVRLAERNPLEHRYEFFPAYCTVQTIRRGEDIGTNKVYYSDLFKIREKGNFLLLYQTAYTVYPVDKCILSTADLTALRAILCLPQR